MLDQKMKPWLIEVNQSPSWTTDTPLDTTIKENVIRDAIRILNISAKDRINFKRKNKEEIEARSLTGKTSKPTEEQLKAEFLKAQEEQDRWESTHDTGGYEMIFPLKVSQGENCVLLSNSLIQNTKKIIMHIWMPLEKFQH